MSHKSALIVGRHPITDAVARHYEDRTFSVIRYEQSYRHGESPDEIFIATLPQNGETVIEDMRNIATLRQLCSGADVSRRLRCHILFHSHQVYKQFQNDSFCADIKAVAEIYPFTEASLWAQHIFTLLPGQKSHFPFTERIPQSVDSDRTVHIVIFGVNDMTEMLAEYAALTCHYPNYVRDHSLRTRITIVDENAAELMYGFINRHKSLFDNSFYRLVDLKHMQGACVSEFHTPDYDGVREDCVDVEWEFVNGGLWSEMLRSKLRTWSNDDFQYLSVILGYEADDSNISAAFEVSKEVADRNIPILIRLTSLEVLELASGITGLMPYGMKAADYDIDEPLNRMAAMVNYVYECCYQDNYQKGNSNAEVFSPVSIDMASASSLWKSLSYSKRMSNIYNAMTIPVKMRSLGHSQEDWTAFYAMSGKEISLLAEMEHNRWNVAVLLLGYRPVDAEQEKEIESNISLKKEYRNKMIHYDIRSYKDLRADGSGRNVNTYDICLAAAIPLIAKTFITDIADGSDDVHIRS